MNPYRNVPDGMPSNDTGTSDTYECACCGRGVEQGELDSNTDEPTCKECAAVEREQHRQEDAEVRAAQATQGGAQ